MPTQKHTFCRICEPHCPLIAHLDDQGTVTALAPNRQSPTGGIACHKGLSFLDVHNDPDRLNWPMKRVSGDRSETSEFERVDWDTALSEIADKLKSVVEKYGPNAVGVYSGNPWSFNGAGSAMGFQFIRTIGTAMQFNAGTVDTSNKFYAASAMYGSMGSTMTPDVHNTDFLLCMGSNPKISRWTLYSTPNDAGQILKDIKDRGGKTLFVNPRKTESSGPDTGETLRIMPGTDVYLLAAILNEIIARDAVDQEHVRDHGANYSGLAEFVSPYTPEHVSDVVGVTANIIRDLVTDILRAPSFAIYIATGVNQSRQGTICYWLADMISLVTGNLGKKGGNYKPHGLADFFPRVKEGKLRTETSLGTLELPQPVGYIAQPTALLPQLIKNGDIRAFFSLGGNPVLSLGGEQMMREACENLDLMVSIDILPSVTTQLSDYALPSVDFLERADINHNGMGLQAIPYVQYTDKITEPHFERRNDWWILAKLLQKMGLPSPLDEEFNQTELSFIESRLSARGLTIEDMRAQPHQTAIFEQGDRSDLFNRAIRHPDGKIDCMPAEFASSGLLERCVQIFAELKNEPTDTLKMITLRTGYMHNSWMANVNKLRKGVHRENPIYMCQADADKRELVHGDKVRVFNQYGEIETFISINDDLRPGAVAMSHGYGHRSAQGLRNASRKPGANCNQLLPIGADTYEPLSNMSWVSAVPVNVERSEHAG